MANRYLPMVERFWAKVEKSDGCWMWTGARWAKGYGQFCNQNKRLLAHRVSYELSVGPIPDGLTLDHLCANKACVNPAHLEPVTRGENVRRWAATITECPQGHRYDDENTYWRRNKRTCRACHRMSGRSAA